MCADSDEWARTKGTSRQGSSCSTSATLTTVFAHDPLALDPERFGPDSLERADSNQPPLSTTIPHVTSRDTATAASPTAKPVVWAIMSSVCGRSAHNASTASDTEIDRRLERRPADVAAVIEAQGHEHIVDARHWSRAVDEQLVRPCCGGVADRARNRHHGEAAIARCLGRDEAAAAVARFDDNQHLAECCDDAIAERKVPILRG